MVNIKKMDGYVPSPIREEPPLAHVQKFLFEQKSKFRMLLENERYLFVASDTCSILGYAQTSTAIKRHCNPKGVMKRHIPTAGGVQELLVVTEGNLYRLISKSKLPSAIKFEEWVFDEVLPSIRKTGEYQLKKAEPEGGKVLKLMSQIDKLELQLKTCAEREAQLIDELLKEKKLADGRKKLLRKRNDETREVFWMYSAEKRRADSLEKKLLAIG